MRRAPITLCNMSNTDKRGTPAQTKSVHVGMRVDPALASAIDALRESAHESRSSVLRRLVIAATKDARR